MIEKDIFERAMNPLAEARVDEENKILRSVVIFGSRQSDNGYTYSNKAVDTLSKKASGTKVYLNHQARSEMRDRDGVRDIRDWAGVIENPRRNGDKVLADFHAREEIWPMVKDVATLLPDKVGFSINSKVWTNKENGKETIADIHTLHSVDFVASGATIQNLFESTRKITEPEKIKGTIIQIRENKIVVDVGKNEPIYVEKKKLNFIPREGQDVTLTYGGKQTKKESKKPIKKETKEVQNMPTLTKEAMRGLESLGRKADAEDLQEAVLNAAKSGPYKEARSGHYHPQFDDKEHPTYKAETRKDLSLTEENVLGAVTRNEGIIHGGGEAKEINQYHSPESGWTTLIKEAK